MKLWLPPFILTFLLPAALICCAVASLDIRGAKVMICAILRTEDPYVDEWLQYHKFLGFDFALLHDNNDTPSPYLSSLRRKYGDFLLIHVLPGLNKQRSAYRRCMESYRNNTWAAFIDIDEFIVLRKHSSIQELLHDVAPTGGSVLLNWSRFSNNGTLKYDPAPVLSRFIYTTRELNRHVKAIVYLNHTKREWVDVHNTRLLPGYPTVDVLGRNQSNRTPWVDNHAGNRDVAYINHYHTKSFEEFVVKKRKGRADLKFGGPNVSDAEILKDFTDYNLPYAEMQDTFARDFYLKRLNGTNTQGRSVSELRP